MLISYSWLLELLPGMPEPAEVGRRLTARGLTVDAITASGSDTVFDLDVPANRPDALGHLGVAREVAAAFGLALTPCAQPPPGSGEPAAATVSVTIEDPALCGRYTARIVRGVRVAPSPDWVVARLSACGLRSINNVVDVSNLVMLELGQPIHFFDLARVRRAEIVVRAARAGERLTTLDGVVRELQPGMIVVADAISPVALGGVMGGAESQIQDDTRDVLIEAAWFRPSAVRTTSRGLTLVTDASQRFERGCDPEAPPLAQDMAVRLLADLAGGTPAPGLVDARPEAPVKKTLPMRLSRASRLLGYPVGRDEALCALQALGLMPSIEGDTIEIRVPSWRVDLEREADVVEEVARHLGYDRIPQRDAAGASQRRGASSLLRHEERVRDRLASLGFCETLSYAMLGPGEDEPFVPATWPKPLRLSNPIAETLAFLRRSLLPGLLAAADQNVRRGAAELRLFEIGGVFRSQGPGRFPEQDSHAAFAWTGSAEPLHWSAPARAVDLWDAAGVIESLLSMSLDPRTLSRERAMLPGLHPGESILWLDKEGRHVAWCGRIHPGLQTALDLSAPVFLGEVVLDAVASREAAVRYRAIPRYPGTGRDLSIVLDPGSAAGEVIDALAAVPAPAPVTMTWMDRYAGPPLREGQAAMTLRVMLQPLERTLTDAEAERYRAELLEALDSVAGARLRRIDT